MFGRLVVPYHYFEANWRFLSLKTGMRGVAERLKILTHTNSDCLGYCQLKLSKNFNPDSEDP